MRFSRRQAVQAGAIGLLGLGMNHLSALRASGVSTEQAAKAKSVIFIFLSGGLAQQDSFDLKPNAPEEFRGEFKPGRVVRNSCDNYRRAARLRNLNAENPQRARPHHKYCFVLTDPGLFYHRVHRACQRLAEGTRLVRNVIW